MTAAVFTVEEAAAYLKVGPKTIRRLCRLKRIPCRLLDRRGTVRISRTALEAYLLDERNRDQNPVGVSK